MVSTKIMTVESEQYSVKYKGTGVVGDTFPVPFSFRHTDALKVETIDANGTATVKTISTHYDVIQMATALVSGSTSSSEIDGNSQRTEYGWIIYNVATTDILHIYKEDTSIQNYDYSDTVAIPAEQFEISCDRVTDCFSTQLTRNRLDPSAYTAQNRKITNLRTPILNDDILTKGVLDNMGTSASLSIPGSGGASDVGKLLTPSGLAPSTPAVAWASRLGLPSTSGTTQQHVLSPVSGYGSAPFVEWTLPRWIEATPNDGLRSVYSYGTGTPDGSSVEGEGTAKWAVWRQFREMLDTPTEEANVGEVIRLKHTTWSPPEDPVAGFEASYKYEQPVEPAVVRSENAQNLRMVAATTDGPTFSPRIEGKTLTVTNLWESGGTTFGNNDGTHLGNSVQHIHPQTEWTLTNTLKDDDDNVIMPQMVFMQCYTSAHTVPATAYAGLPGTTYTAYPIYHVGCNSWLKSNENSNDGFMPDYTPDTGTANDSIKGHASLMNVNRFGIGVDISEDAAYLYWSSAHSMDVHFLLVYDSDSLESEDWYV
jgi:hypothetical protein